MKKERVTRGNTNHEGDGVPRYSRLETLEEVVPVVIDPAVVVNLVARVSRVGGVGDVDRLEEGCRELTVGVLGEDRGLLLFFSWDSEESPEESVESELSPFPFPLPFPWPFLWPCPFSSEEEDEPCPCFLVGRPVVVVRWFLPWNRSSRK